MEILWKFGWELSNLTKMQDNESFEEILTNFGESFEETLPRIFLEIHKKYGKNIKKIE